jgi:hypothetical protein
MATLSTRAQHQLGERLRTMLMPEVVDRFVGGTHTQRFADNLLPTFTQHQISTLRAQLADGSGGELVATRTGKRPAHAPYSSAALAVNAFGAWLGSESLLTIAGLSGFDRPLRVEAKIQIDHGGGLANLDVLLSSPGRVVGVESKLTEALSTHKPVPWKRPYTTAEMAGLLSGGWADLLRLSLAGEQQPVHLHVEQLIKHALALNSHYRELERHLMYCYWEPGNGHDHDEVGVHRKDIADCLRIIGRSPPTLHALPYAELLAEWEALADPPWAAAHVRTLRERYALAL